MSAPKPLLCPRCKSADVRLVEYATTEISYLPKDTVGTQRPGDIEKVVFICHSCKHRHTLRGEYGVGQELLARLAANQAFLARH